MADRVDIVIIDGQNDFLANGNEPENWPWPHGGQQRGALYIEGADVEAVRVADMIKGDGLEVFNKIHASLDGHDRNDGSHNVSWKDRFDIVVDPFTIVTYDDVKELTYTPSFRFGVWEGKAVPAREWALNYTKALAELGRAPLCLWPVHCKKASWGANVYHPLDEAYDAWCDHTGAWIDFISKGGWPWTEHYSALIADVPDPTRPETQMNTGVVTDVAGANRIVWCGWAGSHCTAWTAKDAVNFFEPSDEEKKKGAKNEFVEKSIFLEDACAPVPNPAPGVDFEKTRRDFLDEMQNRGAIISTTTEIFNLL